MALLEIKELSVNINGIQAVTDVNMTINEGETRTIIGPNGAGKTTIIDMITGKTVYCNSKSLQNFIGFSRF